MSLSYLKSVFNALEALDSISVQLLRVTNNKSGTHYHARQIEIKPDKELAAFIKEVCDKYNEEIDHVGSLDEYKGDIVKGNIYKLSLDNDLISTDYQNLETAVADPHTEGSVDLSKWSALLIKGTIMIDGEESEIRLFSMKSPVTSLTNKFILCGKDRFKKVSSPVLTLSKNLDAIIVNGAFYMLTMQAENLFNMERTYKRRCETIVEEVIHLGILTNEDSFRNAATRGQNPRRFVSFNQSKLDALKDVHKRKRYMKMFKIEMKDGKIDTDNEKNPDRLVKFLCDKAMLDPIDEGPREVSAAKVWA